MVALLVFIMATSHTKGPFGDNVFKHPAGCHILLSLPTVLTVDENHVNNLLMTLATSFHYFKTKHQQCSLLALLVSQSLLSFLVRHLIQLNLVVPVYPWFHSLHLLPNTVLPQLVSIQKWCTNAIVYNIQRYTISAREELKEIGRRQTIDLFFGFLSTKLKSTCSGRLPSVNYISTLRTIQIRVWLLKFVGHRTYLKTQPPNFEGKTSLSGEPLLNLVFLLFPNKTDKETKRNEQNGAMTLPFVQALRLFLVLRLLQKIPYVMKKSCRDNLLPELRNKSTVNLL